MRKNHRLTLTDGRLTAYLTADQIVQTARVSHRSAQRYIKDPAKMPFAVRMLLEIRHLGRIYVDGWKGFLMLDGGLQTPTGREWTPGQIEGQVYRDQLIRALERRVKQLEKELQAEKRRPGPPAANEGIF